MDLSPQDITDIIFGRIALMCMLNYACVESCCRDNGVPLTFHHEPAGQFGITVDSKPYGGEDCDGLWDRLLLDALSHQSFTDLIKTIMDEYDMSTD